MWKRVVGVLTMALAVVVGGCAATEEDDGRLDVLASFYPLRFVAERVGGTDALVSGLTPSGAEPHDLELSPAQVRAIGTADVLVTLSGFQPSVDEALAARAPRVVVDAAEVADLEATDGRSDPHFWLDPARLAAVGDLVAQALSDARPESADAFAERAAALADDLAALDTEFQAGLATCESRVIVTTHAAFGYLADRYDLEEISVSGIDPDSEPSPARLREVAAAVEDEDVTTIFAETLVSPKVAEVLATDLGLRTAVLDPVEGLVEPGSDYLSVMRANLAALRAALRCE